MPDGNGVSDGDCRDQAVHRRSYRQASFPTLTVNLRRGKEKIQWDRITENRQCQESFAKSVAGGDRLQTLQYFLHDRATDRELRYVLQWHDKPSGEQLNPDGSVGQTHSTGACPLIG